MSFLTSALSGLEANNFGVNVVGVNREKGKKNSMT